MKSIPVTIDKTEFPKIEAFAAELSRQQLPVYRKRNPDETYENVYSQKIAATATEYAVKKYLERYGKVSGVDLNIYDVKRKSFGADLIFTSKDGKEYNIHVKSQEAKRLRYANNRISWNFQKEDKTTYTPKDNDIIIGVVVNDLQNFDIVLKAKATKVLGHYSVPVKESLRHSKVTLYLDDLLNAGIDPLGKVNG